MFDNLILLPGRLAVLVADFAPDGIALPEAVRLRYADMERPPIPCLCGTVVAVGPPRGAVPMPRTGERVWVLPKPGLIVVPGDLDLPALGAHVPIGHTLRLYGAGDPWHEAVLATEFPCPI